MSDIIGWASSFILLLTLVRQVQKQWLEGSSKGVSKWLFVGQLLASIGFVVYSWLVGNWVFVVTNSLLALNSVIGVYISFHFRRKA
jgi:MtN3 and saliva related transmembrane protein